MPARWGIPLIVVASVTFASCGYSLAGRGSFLPASIKTIGVPLFTNSTRVFEVEQLLTEKVRSEFIGRGKYKVLPEATGVDAVLLGDITSITITPVSVTGQQQAARNLITVTTRIAFRDLTTNTVLWENPGLVFREEYEVATAASALDPAAFFGQESNALERVATEFAKAVVSAILEAF